MEPDYLKTAPFWARQLYWRTTPLGRRNIAALFDIRGWHVEACGRSGYKLFRNFQASVQLRGADNNLGRLVWPAARASGKKRKFGESEVMFEDGRHYFGRDGGLERGKAIHKELEDFVKLSPEQFNQKHPKVDPITSSILLKLKEHKLSPIASEVGVVDVQSCAGTGIDMLCLNERGEIEMVETKTGYVNTNFTEVDNKTKDMKPPYAHLKDTPFVRAQMQNLYGAILLESCMTIRVAGLWIVHGTPDTDTANLHRVGNSVMGCWDLLLSGLREQHRIEVIEKMRKQTIKKAQGKPATKQASRRPIIVIKL